MSVLHAGICVECNLVSCPSGQDGAEVFCHIDILCLLFPTSQSEQLDHVLTAETGLDRE